MTDFENFDAKQSVMEDVLTSSCPQAEFVVIPRLVVST